MHSISFWQNWSKTDRALLLCCAVLFIFSLGKLSYDYFISPSPTIEFQAIQDSDLMEIPVDHFQKGLFDFAVVGNNYTTTERLLGTPLSPNVPANYIFLLVFIVSVVGLLAIVTTLGRFYYLVCMGGFILLVVSLKLEAVTLFGLTDKTFPIAAIAAYVLTSFFISYFVPTLSFSRRLATFAAITIALGGIIYKFSYTPAPFLQLAAYAVPAATICCVVFILMVSHEIVASFIFIVTQGTRQKKSLNHFVIISTIYLINLGLAYAIKFRYIHWNIFTINLVLLLVISGILGLWGIRKRQKQFEGILDVEPYGVLAYLLIGSVSFSAIALFLATANDPILDAMQDMVIFSHIGYGLIFILYVLANFGGMLSENLAVHKVIYSPNNMPFFTFRFAGLIATIAFLTYNTWQVPTYNAIGGFNNAIGDMYLSMHNDDLARLYYEKGRGYGFYNHHSNYALANQAGAIFNIRLERDFYDKGSVVRPTEMSILNWAQTYQTERNNLEAIIVLKEGLQKISGSGPLENTLGVVFAQSNMIDSASKYLNLAQNSSRTKNAAQMNLLSLAIRSRLTIPTDTTVTKNENIGLTGNKIAWANLQQRHIGVDFVIPKDSVLDLHHALFISNFLINNLGYLDSTLNNRIAKLARHSANSGFSEALLYATALSRYSIGEVQEAFQLLEEVTFTSSVRGKYNNILALWSLEQNEPERAVVYADYALEQNYEAAFLTRAVALTERRSLNEAIVAWDSLQDVSDTLTSRLATRMIKILTIPAIQVGGLSDEDKYAYCRYRLAADDSTAFDRVVGSITDEYQKARTLLDRSQLMYSLGDIRLATSYFSQMRGLNLGNQALYEQFKLHELYLLSEASDRSALKGALDQSTTLRGKRSLSKIYFDALLASSTADTAKARQYYDILASANPYFEEGVVAAADFFKGNTKDPLKSYRILATAVQNHPSSVKILRAYCLEAAAQGLKDFSQDGLRQLSTMISASSFKKFKKENQAVLEKEPE